MTINRDNYEEFFLLYVDNELKAHEATALENFVSQNPDLAQELEMLQQATLDDNTIEFTNKKLLYRKDSGISLANYEEYFVLAADKELNKQQIIQVEEFVLKHPQLQDEFTWLHRAKLKPEPFKFSAKKKLYRYEKERRLIPAAWMRISAAAAIIGIIMTTLVVINNNRSIVENNNKSIVLSNSNNKIISEKNNESLVQKSVTKKSSDTLPVKIDRKNNFRSIAAVNHKSKKAVLQKGSGEIKTFEKLIALSKHKISIKSEAIIKADSLPAEKSAVAQQKLPALKQVKTVPFGVSDNANTANVHPGKEPDYTYAKQSVSEQQPVLISHAVYLETDNDEEEKTVYIGSAEINKNKLKGLFKKVSTFIDKKIRQKKD